MTTAALLPTPGDPLLARYWCRNYDQTWRGEVDRLYVYVNGPDPQPAADIYHEHGAIVGWRERRIGHGEAMRWLLDACDADTVVFVEDDAFVREPGAITEALRFASDAHIITGCPRGGMDPAIADAATEKWGPVVGPDGSSGHGLWPAFLFGRRDMFRATSQRFESLTWWPGETIPGLGFRVPSQMTTDTMTAVAFELRDRFPPIKLTVNYKEMDQKVFPGSAPWFHAGGLSNDPLSMRDGIPPESNEGRDWAHRFWWWRRIGHDYDPRGQDVDYWTPILEPWISWDE